jgi:hypothetical protein
VDFRDGLDGVKSSVLAGDGTLVPCSSKLQPSHYNDRATLRAREQAVHPIAYAATPPPNITLNAVRIMKYVRLGLVGHLTEIVQQVV